MLKSQSVKSGDDHQYEIIEIQHSILKYKRKAVFNEQSHHCDLILINNDRYNNMLYIYEYGHML